MSEEKPKTINQEKASEIKTFLSLPLICWVDIELNFAFMCIEKRPDYCDRGRYSVKAWHKPDHYEKCHIDYSDAFARYYFNFDCMIKEINSFISFRGLEVKEIFFRTTTLEEMSDD